MPTLKILKQTSEKLILQIQPQRVERIWRTGFAAFWIALLLIFHANSIRDTGAFRLTDRGIQAEQVDSQQDRSTNLGLMQQAPVTFTLGLGPQVDIWFGLILILGSGLWIFAPAVCAVRLEFDHSANRLSYRWRHLLGRQTKQYALERIERVELRSYWDSDEGEPFYLPMLVFEKHTPLVLWEDWNLQTGEKVVAVIQEFLDRPRMSRTE